MCMCMCVCMCMYTFMNGCPIGYLRLDIGCMYVCIFVCMYVSIYSISVCMYVYLYVCMYVIECFHMNALQLIA